MFSERTGMGKVAPNLPERHSLILGKPSPHFLVSLPKNYDLGIIYERPEDQCRRRPRGLSIRRTFTVSSKAPATSFMLGVEPSRFLRQSLFMLWHLASPFTDAQTRHERC